MKKQTRFFLTILCMVFLCVFAFSGYKLYSIIHEYRVDQQKYNLGAVIGIFTFVVLAVVSLVTYRSSGSYKDEEGFK